MELEASKFYAIGLLVGGAHTEYRSADAVQPVSFGAIVGTMRTDIDTVPGQIWIEPSFDGAQIVRVMTR